LSEASDIKFDQVFPELNKQTLILILTFGTENLWFTRKRHKEKLTN